MKTYTYWDTKISRETYAKTDDFLRKIGELYNLLLAQNQAAYDMQERKSLTKFDQINEFKHLRKQFPEFAQYSSRGFYTAFNRLHWALDGLKKGISGYPKWKSEKNPIRSFDTSQIRVHKDGQWNRFSVKGVGTFRFKGEVPENVKRITVLQRARRTGVQLVADVPKQFLQDPRSPLGLDRGVRNLYALSNGVTHPGLEFDTTKLKRYQRRFSLTEKGSGNHQRWKERIAKESARIATRRRHQLHRIVDDLLKNQGQTFVVEDLKIKNMTTKGRCWKKGLNRRIVEQGWGEFLILLEQKGARIVRVPPHHTSLDCSSCGNRKKSLTEEIYHCKECGLELCRDINAAKNILARGKELL